MTLLNRKQNGRSGGCISNRPKADSPVQRSLGWHGISDKDGETRDTWVSAPLAAAINGEAIPVGGGAPEAIHY